MVCPGLPGGDQAEGAATKNGFGNRFELGRFCSGEKSWSVPVLRLAHTANQPPTVYLIHADQIDTPRMVQDAQYNNRWAWDADGFGQLPPNENPAGLGNFSFNLRMPGQYYDAESGLFYNHFRDYDPQAGRYIESDPIGLAGGENLYGYVKNSPLLRVDPMGLLDAPPIDLNQLEPSSPSTEYPGFDRRPHVPPPPPPPSDDSDPWPGQGDWRGQCIRLYELCVRKRWSGNCGACLNKCTAQQEWPFQGPGSCKPKNQCNIGDL